MEKKICAITGIGLISCFGPDKEKFYSNLLEGQSGVTQLDLDITGFDYLIGASVKDYALLDYLDRKRANNIDPSIGYSIAGSYNAIADSGIDISKINKLKAGVLVGTGIGGMHTACKNFRKAHQRNFAKVSPFFIPHMITNMGGALVAREFGFQGVNYSISTACATSNYSLINAKKHIEFGECDIILAGGVEASMNEASYGGFSALRALSKSREKPATVSKPFDVSRDGFVMGEGAGVFILEELEHALNRGGHIYGILSGGAYTCDAYHMTNPLPDGEQVARCITMALKDAKLRPEDIDYINAHATSTPAGDISEIRGIKKVFSGSNNLPKINSTKSMIGHALGASGGLELAAVLMGMEKQKLHPTINVEKEDEEVKGFDIITKGACDHKVNHAISNSIGFGGHNSSLVISKYDPKKTNI